MNLGVHHLIVEGMSSRLIRRMSIHTCYLLGLSVRAFQQVDPEIRPRPNPSIGHIGSALLDNGEDPAYSGYISRVARPSEGLHWTTYDMPGRSAKG